jgi:hypothetical protein
MDPSAAPHIEANFLRHPYDRRAIIEAFHEMLRWMQAPIWHSKTVRRLGWPEDDSDDAILVRELPDTGGNSMLTGDSNK